VQTRPLRGLHAMPQADDLSEPHQGCRRAAHQRGGKSGPATTTPNQVLVKPAMARLQYSGARLPLLERATSFGKRQPAQNSEFCTKGESHGKV
jgi:hypothetical protein